MLLPRWTAGGGRIFALLAVIFAATAAGQTSWTNSSSGFWRESANWSAGVPLFEISLTLITNANTKTVTVDSATPLPNLEIDRLTISAPNAETNTLLLDNLGATADFKVVGLAAVNGGGAVRVNNSTLFVDGLNGGAMDVNAGELTLLSGGVTLGEFGRFRVGISGSAIVNVLGGVFTAGNEFILGGGLPGAHGTVNVSGGELNINVALVVADDAGTSGTVLVNGGKLVSTNALEVTRIGDDGAGTVRLESGTAEFWDVSIGRSPGSQGAWNISGGTAQTKDISIGRFAGATGTLNITGGSLLLPDDSLLIGREGAGTVNISGGLVISADVTMATNSASSGTLTMTAGTLKTDEFVVGAIGGAAATVTVNDGVIRVDHGTNVARLVVANGTVTVNGGAVEVNSLVVTNTAGSLRLNGGTIVSSDTYVANGQAFVVGDGARPAIFRLNGGVHTFENGLVISSNASVLGCGQIVGTILNNGVLSTNCGAIAPTLTNAQRSQTQFSFAIQTEAGVVYTVEYKNSLSDATWTKLNTYTGTGGAVTVTDIVANDARFYRAVIY